MMEQEVNFRKASNEVPRMDCGEMGQFSNILEYNEMVEFKFISQTVINFSSVMHEFQTSSPDHFEQG